MPGDTLIHNNYEQDFEHIWATNAIPSYRLVTNLGLYFLIAFSWNSSSNRANIIQFKSPFSSPTSIFFLLRKPLFQELTLTRMGSSWKVEMQGPGCVFQSHLGRAVTEESYKGDLISLHVLTEFNSRLLAEYASQSEISHLFSDTTCMVKWKFTEFPIGNNINNNSWKQFQPAMRVYWNFRENTCIVGIMPTIPRASKHIQKPF